MSMVGIAMTWWESTIADKIMNAAKTIFLFNFFTDYNFSPIIRIFEVLILNV
jgi:hypothetical protein